MYKQEGFGRSGSYWYVEHITGDFRESYIAPSELRGTYIGTSKGKAVKREIVRIAPLYKGEEVKYDCEYAYERTTLQAKQGKLEITYGSTDTILIKGTGKDVSLLLDPFPSKAFAYWDHTLALRNAKGREYFISAKYDAKTRYFVYAIKGSIKLEQNYYGDEYQPVENPYSRLIASGDDFVIAIQEIENNSQPFMPVDYDFEKCAKANLAEFEKFYKAFKPVKEEYKDIAKHIAYIFWVSTANPSGCFTAPVVLGNFRDHRIYKFENGLACLGIAYGHPELAYNTLAQIFNTQDKYGCLPGSMSSSGATGWVFLKAPNDGLFFKYVEKRKKFNKQQLETIYDGLGKHVNFYFDCHDSNGDGICEYFHGNDSDDDNMSVFDDQVATDSPELMAYLINDMDYLSDIAKRLGKQAEAKVWKKRANEALKKSLEYFFDEDKNIFARQAFTGERIESRSIQPYFFLTLGNRLPKEYRTKLIEDVKKNFVSEYGLVTEPYDSPKYDPKQASFFRGRLFYQTVLIMDVMYDNGEKELVKKLAKSFVKLMEREGIYDCYNSKTGKGIGVWSSTADAGMTLYQIYKFLSD